MILRRRVISYLHMTHTLHRPKNYSEPHAAAAAAPAASFSPATRKRPVSERSPSPPHNPAPPHRCRPAFLPCAPRRRASTPLRVPCTESSCPHEADATETDRKSTRLNSSHANISY